MVDGFIPDHYVLSVKAFLGRPTWGEKIKVCCRVPIYIRFSKPVRPGMVRRILYVDSRSTVLYHNQAQGVFIGHRQYGSYSLDKMELIPKQ